MPWRFALFIVILAVMLLFIMFNLNNKCDINFGFTVQKDVPVFLTAFSSFIGGLLCSVPFIFILRSRKKNPKPQEKGRWGKKTGENPPANNGQYGID